MKLLSLIPGASEMLATYRKRMQIADELNAYSDRELTDLGIARSEINAIARRAVR